MKKLLDKLKSKLLSVKLRLIAVYLRLVVKSRVLLSKLILKLHGLKDKLDKILGE